MSRGFTLIELLVVITLIGVLAALLISTVGSVRERADLAGCASNLRQIGQAVILYTAEHDGLLPLNRGSGGSPTWSRLIIDKGYISEGEVWRCPSHRPMAGTDPDKVRSYIINGWITGPWGHSFARQEKLISANEKYGAATRGLLVEKWTGGGESGGVRDNTHSEFQENLNYLLWLRNTSGPHKNFQTNMLFLDGHVEIVTHTGQGNYTELYKTVAWRWF